MKTNELLIAGKKILKRKINIAFFFSILFSLYSFGIIINIILGAREIYLYLLAFSFLIIGLGFFLYQKKKKEQFADFEHALKQAHGLEGTKLIDFVRNNQAISSHGRKPKFIARKFLPRGLRQIKK